jgi:hypothetical protein
VPVTIPNGGSVQGWVTDQVANQYETSLPAGDVLSVASADTADFTASIDAVMATPPPDVAAQLQALGATAVASFTVQASATPSQPNVAVGITLSASGTTIIAPASESDTVTVSETELQVLGTLWGAPVVPSVSSKA